MVKFTIEQIRALMDYKDNIRNMSGTPCYRRAPLSFLSVQCFAEM